MAIKERLLKQLNIVRDGLNAMPPFHSRDLNAMRNALVQAAICVFRGFPSADSANTEIHTKVHLWGAACVTNDELVLDTIKSPAARAGPILQHSIGRMEQRRGCVDCTLHHIVRTSYLGIMLSLVIIVRFLVRA